MTIPHLDRNIDSDWVDKWRLGSIVDLGDCSHAHSALLHTVTARNQVINNRDRNQDGRPDDAECR